MNNQMTRADIQPETQPDILLDIPEHIWQQCEAYKECPEGWWETAKKVEAVLLAEGVKVVQMKEKFGELRVYWDEPNEWEHLEDETRQDKVDLVNCLIDIADWVCQKTCEVCGEKGEMYNDGWIYVLCDKHHNEWQRE